LFGSSLVTPFFNALYVEANVRASDEFGVVFNASYLSLENDDWRTNTFTAGTGVTYHFQGDALRHWYVEADGELWFSSWRHAPSGKVSSIVLGFGAIALVGYRFICERGPVLDLGAGAVAFHMPSAHVAIGAEDISSDALTRIYPAVKVSVGWAF
jgi:hypothetical protein